MDKRSKNRPVSPAAVTASSGFSLKVLLGLSLAANVVMIGFLVAARRDGHTHEAEKVVSTPPPSASVSPAPAVSVGDAPLSRDLRPYAALGTFVAENNHIPALNWNDAQFAAFQQGMRSSFEGRGYPVDDDAIKLRDQISAKVQSMLDSKRSDPIEDYFRTLREKEGVLKTDSGLHYRVTDQGNGEKPGPDATIVVSYSGRLPDGRSLPMLVRTRVKTPVKDLLPGLAEGVQLLAVGGKALVYLPPSLSFKNNRWPEGIPQGAPIILFVELHDINPW